MGAVPALGMAYQLPTFVDVTLSVRHYILKMGLNDKVLELPRPIDAMDFRLFIGANSTYSDIMPKFDAALKEIAATELANTDSDLPSIVNGP